MYFSYSLHAVLHIILTKHNLQGQPFSLPDLITSQDLYFLNVIQPSHSSYISSVIINFSLSYDSIIISTCSFTYSLHAVLHIILTKQPVLRIIKVERDSVEASSSEYSLIKDTGGYARSSRGYDKLRINTQSTTTLTIEYEYDGVIQSVQNLLDHEDNNIIKQLHDKYIIR